MYLTDGSVCISLNAEFFKKKKKYSLKQVTEEIRLGEKKKLWQTV